MMKSLDLSAKNKSDNLTYNLLERTGFTDITENPDGTFDATNDGFHYKGIRITGHHQVFEDNTIISTQPVPLIGKNKNGLC